MDGILEEDRMSHRHPCKGRRSFSSAISEIIGQNMVATVKKIICKGKTVTRNSQWTKMKSLPEFIAPNKGAGIINDLEQGAPDSTLQSCSLIL
jgi:hypothetical protein